MIPPEETVDRYFAIWNETDPVHRRKLITRAWAEDARYIDPAQNGAGHDGIDAMVAALHARFPGQALRLTGPIDAHNSRARFDWEMGPPEAPLVRGVDFAELAEDGRLQSITGFFNA